MIWWRVEASCCTRIPLDSGGLMGGSGPLWLFRLGAGRAVACLRPVPCPPVQCVPQDRELNGTARMTEGAGCGPAEQNRWTTPRGLCSGSCRKGHKLIRCTPSAGDVTGWLNKSLDKESAGLVAKLVRSEVWEKQNQAEVPAEVRGVETGVRNEVC